MVFIFDIGNVLIHFKPKEYLTALFHDPALEEALYSIIFASEEWAALDRGVIGSREACARYCARAPRYRIQIDEAMERLPEMLTPLQETVSLLPMIKEAGHQLYFLSNYHQELRDYIQKKYPFFQLFDGGVFSCDVHLVKPQEAIYRYFLEKYGLDPQHCVFFDDVEENIRSAERCGIKSVLFTGTSVVEEYLLTDSEITS
jgi:putative hydrolase of the HAD superfamily